MKRDGEKAHIVRIAKFTVEILGLIRVIEHNVKVNKHHELKIKHGKLSKETSKTRGINDRRFSSILFQGFFSA